MKQNTLLLLTFMALLLTSCSRNYVSHRSVNIERNDLIATPVVAEISVDIQKKITAESGKKANINLAKDEAYYKAITDNKIDVLVDPVYNITTTPRILFFGGKAIATVTGFAGKYTGTKPVFEAVKQYNLDTNHVKNFNALVRTSKTTNTPSAFEKPVDPRKQSVGGIILTAVLFFVAKSIIGF